MYIDVYETPARHTDGNQDKEDHLIQCNIDKTMNESTYSTLPGTFKSNFTLDYSQCRSIFYIPQYHVRTKNIPSLKQQQIVIESNN